MHACSRYARACEPAYRVACRAPMRLHIRSCKDRLELQGASGSDMSRYQHRTLLPSSALPSRRCPCAASLSGKIHLASATCALANSEITCPDDVSFPALLCHACFRNRPFGGFFLAVSFQLLSKLVFIAIDFLPSTHLAHALLLRFRLVVVLSFNDANNMHFMSEAYTCRQDERLALCNPTHLLHQLNAVGNIGNGRLDLGICQIDFSELLLSWITHHITGELLDESQGVCSNI
mmetsp:Transcript_123246/g.227054  ORF Transcript_123246/g.227054 Transcript_123246/m.227054 type:complete len:234 (-) Transcript_123246:180-881(-)